MSSIELIVLWATFLWNGILNFDNNKQTFKASKSSPSLNLSNKCFIHSPALDKPKIIVFWLYWQQDFKLGFIEAGLLIKHLLDDCNL
jgi:hypothetical protein